MSDAFKKAVEWYKGLPTWAKIAVPGAALGAILLIWKPWAKASTATTETAGGAIGGGGGGGGSYGSPPPIVSGPAPVLTTSPNPPALQVPTPLSYNNPATTPSAGQGDVGGTGNKHHPAPVGTKVTQAVSPTPPQTPSPTAAATPVAVVSGGGTSPLPASVVRQFQRVTPTAPPQPAQVIQAERRNSVTPVTLEQLNTSQNFGVEARAQTAANQAVAATLPPPVRTAIAKNPATPVTVTARQLRSERAAAIAKAVKTLAPGARTAIERQQGSTGQAARRTAKSTPPVATRTQPETHVPAAVRNARMVGR